MAAKESLGVFIDPKTVYAAFLSGAKAPALCSVPIAGNAEDLDFDAKITDAVRGAVQQICPQQKSAYVAIPGSFSMVRSFEIPALTKKEEAQAVRFEAQKYVPFDLKELCFDYDVLPVPGSKRVNVLFYAGKKSSIERLVSCVEGAGLTVAAVEILPLSLARSFNREIVKNSGAIYMLARFGEDGSVEMVVAKNQAVLMSRHVALDKSPDMPGWDASPFLAEMRLSLDYFEDAYKGQSLSKIYVSAPTREAMQTLTEIIHQIFSIAAEAVSLGGGSPNSPGLAVAHGLALRDASGARRRINLRAALPSAPAGGSSQSGLKPFATKAVLLALGSLVILYLYAGQVVGKARNELSGLSTQLPSSPTTPATASKEELASRKELLLQKINFMSEVFERRRFLTSKLNSLAKNTPAEIRLLTFSYDDRVASNGKTTLTMKLEGYVSAEESSGAVALISKFISTLQNDPDFFLGFKQVKLASSKSSVLPGGAAVTRFEIECVTTA